MSDTDIDSARQAGPGSNSLWVSPAPNSKSTLATALSAYGANDAKCQTRKTTAPGGAVMESRLRRPRTSSAASGNTC
jgi:hypothetical protein